MNKNIFLVPVSILLTSFCFGQTPPLVVGNVSYPCGAAIDWHCYKIFNFTSVYHCSPDNKTCQASITCEIKKDGQLIKAASTGTGSISDGFTPLANGTCTITLNATCNGKPCEPCSYTIAVTDGAPGAVCGTQVFATTNLNVGTMITSNNYGQMQTNDGLVQKYCYNNVPANCATYGGLYEWGEAMGYAASNNNDQTGARVQGICPAGYHIPSDLEWSRYEYCIESTIQPTGPTTLVTFQTTFGLFVGSDGALGPATKMKSNIGWNGTNTIGFNALPAGMRAPDTGLFYNLGTFTFYWSATQSNVAKAIYHSFLDGGGQAYKEEDTKSTGFSVRCMKD